MKELTEQEQKRIEQLQRRIERDTLELEFTKSPFPRQFVDYKGEWSDILDSDHGWGDEMTYRRKPAPRFVPWTREDAEEFRGIWVREKGFTAERMIVSVHRIGVGIDVDDISYISLFENFTKLDGTPCGKEEK